MRDRAVLHRVEVTPASLRDVVVAGKLAVALGAAKLLAISVLNVDVDLAGLGVQLDISHDPM